MTLIKNSRDFKNLKRKLDYHYKFFDKNQISPDPLEFPHKFKSEPDVEISAFVSSVFAYGNIKQIIASLKKIHSILGDSPYDFVLNFNSDINPFESVNHRFYRQADVFALFKILNFVCLNYGSLKKFFLLYYFPNTENLKDSMEFFSNNLKNLACRLNLLTKGVKFMFPSPSSGSACKRINLFLRWMVRKDDLDFGLWNEIKPSQLIIPVDIHIATIARELRLTKRKNISWKMAEEITQNLKLFNPTDPIKYDFALCHIGARKMNF